MDDKDNVIKEMRAKIGARGGYIRFNKRPFLGGKVIVHSLRNAIYGCVDETILVSYTIVGMYNDVAQKSYINHFVISFINELNSTI
jgi:hypothetical protein